MKETHNKETNKEDKYETIDTIYNKEEDKYELMNLDCKTLTPDPYNPDQVIDSND